MDFDLEVKVSAPRDSYDPNLTLQEARGIYFEANDFGEDGGYSKDTVQVKLGLLPLEISNPPSRVEAVKFHDLHHIVTGYQTNWRGEFEISCYEIRAGCGRLWFAWLINLGGVAGGLMFLPRRSARAWTRGRVSGGLYRTPYNDALLERTVGEMTASLNLDGEDPRPTLMDWLSLTLTALTVTAAILAPVAGIFSLTWWLVS